MCSAACALRCRSIDIRRRAPRALPGADKAFDSDRIVSDLSKRGAKIVVSRHSRRSKLLPLDRELYKWRRLIENFFWKLNDFKYIAMRADKTDESLSAIVHLAGAVINSR